MQFKSVPITVFEGRSARINRRNGDIRTTILRKGWI